MTDTGTPQSPDQMLAATSNLNWLERWLEKALDQLLRRPSAIERKLDLALAQLAVMQQQIELLATGGQVSQEIIARIQKLTLQVNAQTQALSDEVVANQPSIPPTPQT